MRYYSCGLTYDYCFKDIITNIDIFGKDNVPNLNITEGTNSVNISGTMNHVLIAYLEYNLNQMYFCVHL